MSTRDRAPRTCDHWGTIVVLDGNGQPVTSWPLRGCGEPDLAAIDDLSSLALVARRMGGSMEVREVCPPLRALIELTGLTGVLLG
jgi:hypothetical protein